MQILVALLQGPALKFDSAITLSGLWNVEGNEEVETAVFNTAASTKGLKKPSNLLYSGSAPHRQPVDVRKTVRTQKPSGL